MSLLQIQDLQTCFQTPQGVVRAVDGVSLELDPGEVLGVVGESGCGKSVLALSILRLLPMPPAFFAGGRILFEDQNLLQAEKAALLKIRGNRISMIFQEPMSALNPVFTIGNQIAEVYRIHRRLSAREARDHAVAMLEKVGVPAPQSRVREYPYQLSGGMRQRVMIAMALACRPQLLIADEPTTALDVTIQAQIIDLMSQLQQELGSAIIMISHDLGIIAETAHRVAVMYAGRIVETAAVQDLFDRPRHPYTRGLMRAIPSIGATAAGQMLYEIKGVVPSLVDLAAGCSFAPRCPRVASICRQQRPALRPMGDAHHVACWMAEDA